MLYEILIWISSIPSQEHTNSINTISCNYKAQINSLVRHWGRLHFCPFTNQIEFRWKVLENSLEERLFSYEVGHGMAIKFDRVRHPKIYYAAGLKERRAQRVVVSCDQERLFA
jgi:hypothetical protein